MVEYALVQAGDLSRAYALEFAGFPEDEAASLESLTYRQQNAASLFLGAYASSPRELVGYICSTRTPDSTLSHASMSRHDPTGPYVAIHSVCIEPSQRRKGLALNLLEEYLRRLAEMDGVKGARLVSHEELIPLYQKAGFELVGKSDVVHGGQPWFELKVDFPSSGPTPSSSSPLVDDAPIDTLRSPGKMLASRAGAVQQLVDPQTGLNAADLYCPRAECRCLLLRRGTGKWVRGHQNDFELPALPQKITSPPSPSSSASASPSQGYWSVPSPLSFENIGFSRNTSLPSTSAPSSPSSATIKYLTCADCDHGPLGWHDTEGRDLGVEVQAENDAREARGTGGEVRKGREFLLDVGRVRYKV
ncbi:hypothetical protein JCM21900_005014 [Sporobolomyces salmonicolor]